ncbi:MAG: hypothetical protein M3Y07_17700 [Acidobacteriota bacterium]|nr:hypothetical protein [Acidobacteriota bacterium]
MRADRVTATIEIKVDDQGRFTYDVDGANGGESVHIFRGSTVSWISADGNFSVLFKDQTPFKDVTFGAAKGQYTPAAKVKSSAAFQGFGYSALVIKNGITWENDPEIVIDDGAKGHAPAGKKKSGAKPKKSAPKKQGAKKKSR